MGNFFLKRKTYSSLVDKNVYIAQESVSHRFYGDNIPIFKNLIKPETICLTSKLYEDEESYNTELLQA